MLGTLIRLMIEGCKQGSREARTREHFITIQKHWENILEQMLAGWGVDEIADQYEQTHSIPPTQTILFISHFIKALAESSDPCAREAAELLTLQQHVDAITPPLDYIRQFDFDRTLFGTSRCVVSAPHWANGLTEGLMIIGRPYLYFFPISEEVLNGGYGGERAMGLASDLIGKVVPGWDGIATAWDVISSVSEATDCYFNETRIEWLQDAFQSEMGFAIPLVRVTSVCSVNDTVQILRVTAQGNTTGELAFFFSPVPNSDLNWAAKWHDLVQLACVGEGCLLA